jgi:hypothetical protein
MPDEDHSGWSNYETWCVYSRLMGDEAARQYWQDTAKEYPADEPHLLAERMQSELEASIPAAHGTLWGDLLRHSLYRCNFDELALALFKG